MFNAQDYDVDNLKLTIWDSITDNRNPTLDEELSNKMYADDDLDKNNSSQIESNTSRLSQGFLWVWCL